MSKEEIDYQFQILDSIAPEGYNFGFHIRFSRPLIVRMTYDSTWSQCYSANKFILNDPAVIWGLTQDEPRRWSAIDLPDPLGVFKTAAEHGYKYGVALGCGSIDQRSLGSCGRGDREYTDDEIKRIQNVISKIHQLMDKGPSLSERQKEALQIFETGLTYDQICAELTISRTALKSRLAGARKALGARNNVEAVRIALERGILDSTSYTGITQGLPPG